MRTVDPIVAPPRFQRSESEEQSGSTDNLQRMRLSECGNQIGNRPLAVGFKKGPRPRLFDPKRPMIAIACLDCGHVALRLQKLPVKSATRQG